MRTTSHLVRSAMLVMAVIATQPDLTADVTNLTGDHAVVAGGGESGDLTIEGSLTTEGALDVYGAIQAGSTEETTPRSALSLAYDEDGTTYTLSLGATRDAVKFRWLQNLGGTTHPKMELDASNKLTLFNASGVPIIVLDPATGAVTVAGQTIGGGTGIWETNGSDVFLDSGKVGIGTDTPSEKLTIGGNIALTGANRTISTEDRVESGSGYDLTLRAGAAGGETSDVVDGGDIGISAGFGMRMGGNVVIAAGLSPGGGLSGGRLELKGSYTWDGEGGDVSLAAGIGPVRGGDLSLNAGNSDGSWGQTGVGGSVNITSGQGNGVSGAVNIAAANGGYEGGNLSLAAGSGEYTGGNVSIAAGSGFTGSASNQGLGGSVSITSGEGGPYGYVDGGNIQLAAAPGSANGGNIGIFAGAGYNMNAGATAIRGGDSYYYDGGGISLVGGKALGEVTSNADSQGGAITIPGGVNASGSGVFPPLSITGGSSPMYSGGDVAINGGATADSWQEYQEAVHGDVLLANLRGNVGVGTDAPQAKLDVNGSMIVRGNLSFTDGTTLSGADSLKASKLYDTSGTLRLQIATDGSIEYSGNGGINFGTGLSTGTRSVSFGGDNVVEGQFAGAVGNLIYSTGSSSFATGMSSGALGDYSFASGVGSTAEGTASIALGQSWAEGDYSFAANTSTASADYAAAFGSAAASGAYAFAGGQSEASGLASTAFGAAEASGYASFAAGDSPLASAPGSVALGLATTSSGQGSFAAGVGTTASDSATFAAGYSTDATMYGAAAFGDSSLASGYSSFAANYFTEATGAMASAFGFESKATAFASFAVGRGAIASGEASTSFGEDTRAQSYASFAAGKFNVGGGNPDTWIATDPLFELGKGTSDTNRSNAFTVFKNGNADLAGGLTLHGGLTLSDSTVLSGATSLRQSALYDSGGTARLSFDGAGNLLVSSPILLENSANGFDFGDGNKLDGANVAYLRETMHNLGYRDQLPSQDRTFSLPGEFSQTKVAFDAAGSMYMTGTLFNSGMIGTNTFTSVGNSDVFIAKFSNAGVFQWARSFGGTSSDVPNAIGVDSSGNAYVVGYFLSTISSGLPQSLVSAGSSDAFLVKLNSGGTVQWATRVGGTGVDTIVGLALDSGGNAYVAGNFTGTVSNGLPQALASAGSNDAFVAKFNSGGAAQWGVRFGGAGSENATGIALGGDGNAYVTGNFSGSISSGLPQTLVSAGSNDVFVAKFNGSGAAQWGARFGGTNSDGATGIALDSGNNAIVVGSFAGTINSGLPQSLVSAGSNDVFVAKFNGTGAAQWGARFGGTGQDLATGIAVDSGNNAIVTGNFEGTIASGLPQTMVSSGNADIFVAKFNGGGVAQWGKRFGSQTSYETSYAVASQQSGGLVLIGYASENFWIGNQIVSDFFTYFGTEASILSDPQVATVAFSWGNSKTSAVGAVSIGDNSLASGLGSTALGGGTSSGEYGFAVGLNARASGLGSSALGWSIASGETSTAMGASSALGYVSTAMGAANAIGDGSTAMGFSSARGYGSTAMGDYSNANGYASTAMGNSTASGDGATAMGYSNASGSVSVAMGNSTASGSYSAALGYATASGEASTSMGYSSASGYKSTAMGGSSASGDGSTAMGESSSASGYAATAMGYSHAGGPGSTAMGYATAGEEGSTAMGFGSAGGAASTAMGQGNASGSTSTAMGSSSAMGWGSTSMGVWTTASGDGSTVMGMDSTASGYASTAMGFSNATGNASTSMGAATWASGYASTSMGYATVSSEPGQLVVGSYNVSEIPPVYDEYDPATWPTEGAILIVGNGNAANALSNAVIVRRDGVMRTSNTIEAKGGVRVPQQGDLSMGDFTASPAGSPDPGTLDVGLTGYAN